MDVPFRGMQRQHQLVYLAALENPSPSDGTVSDINMQSYAAFNATGYQDAQEVRKRVFSATMSIAGRIAFRSIFRRGYRFSVT